MAFTGGTLRVLADEKRATRGGRLKLVQVELEPIDFQPYGRELVLPALGSIDVLDGRARLNIEVRGGQPVCVSIEVTNATDRLTSTMLRLLSPDREVRDWVMYSAHRLIELPEGELAAVPLASPRSADDSRSFRQRADAATRAHDSRLATRGRPPLSDELLRRVGAAAAHAPKRGKTAAVLALVPEAAGEKEGNVRKWMQKARAKGYEVVSPAQPRGLT